MELTRRALFLGSGSLALCATPLTAIAAPKLDMRVWTGDDSTRISIESDKKLDFSYMVLRNRRPFRLVLDLKKTVLTSAFESRVKRIRLDDPYIRSIRVAQYKPTVVRLVFELKGDVRPVFNQRNPIDTFGHRLILELGTTNRDLMKQVIDRTTTPDDPIRDILKQSEPSPKQSNVVREETGRQRPKQADKKSAKTETLVVVIDPGHGGEDPGAVGRRLKTYEKTVVLSIAQKLADAVNRTQGMKAILTRRRDVFLPLSRRANIAVKERAHLFISIHADAWTSSKANGTSVFTLSTSGASSLQARWLAQTQNRADEIGGMDFKDVGRSARDTVVDMLAETKLRYGLQLGASVLTELKKLGPLHKSTVESANFAVLKAQGIPSILIETGFLSNPSDERNLRNTTYQTKIAKAIYRGVCQAVKDDPSILRGA